jgi:hypothetical protein
MNRSNFELFMDCYCNHKRVCQLSVSRTLNAPGFPPRPFYTGRGTKVRGSFSGTCDFSERKFLTLPSPFERERTSKAIAYSSI